MPETPADEFIRRAAEGTPPKPSVPARERKVTPTMMALREGLMGIYTAAQMAVFMFDGESALIIENTKDKCADAWIELAERDPKVKQFLVRITSGSAWGGVIIAHGMMIIPILAKRGIVPGGALFDGALFNMTPEPNGNVTGLTPEELFEQEFKGSVEFGNN